MNYEKVRNRSSQFESVTSVKVSEFDEILSFFTPVLNRRMRKTSRGTVRLNKIEFPVSLPSTAHVLFFTLTYLKLKPLQEQHGASFDMSQESVSRWFRIGERCLNECLRKMGYMPHRQGGSLSEYLKKNV
mgnify:FL=1